MYTSSEEAEETFTAAATHQHRQPPNSMACHCRYMQAPHLHSRLRHVLSARAGQGLEKGLRGLKHPDDLLLCPAGISVLATSAAGQGRQAAEVVPMYLQGPSLQAQFACWGCRTKRPGSWKCSREPTGQSDARPELREGRRAGLPDLLCRRGPLAGLPRRHKCCNTAAQEALSAQHTHGPP